MTDEGFKRKLTSILSADAVGYSRLMEDDEEATVRTLTSYREVIATLIKQYNGMVVDSPGDNLLAEFVSVVDAVQCAVSVQNEINARNEDLPENRKMQFRIGINLGDVIQEGERIYGDGVNIAARLEGLADPGGICISKTAFDQIERKLPYGYEFIGDQTVKNISKPVGAYRVMLEPRVTVAGEPEEEKPAPVRRIPILGWVFPQEGARKDRSIIPVSTGKGTGSGSYARMLLLSATASATSILNLLPVSLSLRPPPLPGRESARRHIPGRPTPALCRPPATGPTGCPVGPGSGTGPGSPHFS